MTGIAAPVPGGAAVGPRGGRLWPERPPCTSFPTERLRPLEHDRQRMGVDHRLVQPHLAPGRTTRIPDGIGLGRPPGTRRRLLSVPLFVLFPLPARRPRASRPRLGRTWRSPSKIYASCGGAEDRRPGWPRKGDLRRSCRQQFGAHLDGLDRAGGSGLQGEAHDEQCGSQDEQPV